MSVCFVHKSLPSSHPIISMGQLDPCHSNFLKLDLMLKIMPLSGMIFNMTPKFTELWWHDFNPGSATGDNVPTMNTNPNQIDAPTTVGTEDLPRMIYLG